MVTSLIVPVDSIIPVNILSVKLVLFYSPAGVVGYACIANHGKADIKRVVVRSTCYQTGYGIFYAIAEYLPRHFYGVDIKSRVAYCFVKFICCKAYKPSIVAYAIYRQLGAG